MFRRLFTSFVVLTLVLLIGAIVIMYRAVEGPDRLVVYTELALLLLGGLLFALGLTSWLSLQMVRPVKDLIVAVEAMGSGGKARVFPTDQDEVSLLGESFNRMSERLGRHIAELEEDRQQLRTILSGMVEGVVALDAEQRVLFANARAGELLEFSSGTSPVGRHLWEVVRHRHLLDAVTYALLRPEPHREEISWAGHVARTLTVHAARLPGEPPRGAVVVLHDTTELRRLERLREEFVANVSHELKTPLSVIKVCVETLQDGAAEDPTHRDRFLDQIARQGDRLHALILDLLRLARIESGEEMFDFTNVPLRTIVEDCIERLRPRAESKRQQLVLELESSPIVWADEEAVDTVLENLLDNAVKYTPEEGTIRVKLQSEEGLGRIEVSDTGIGIPASDLPRIFERFYRVDKARSRELGGTGLGLSIVKHLIQEMHGTVTAQSEVSVGTTFKVVLPLVDP